MTTIKRLTQENDKLRLLLATSKADCAYCGLPAEAMAKCASGFPGCSRADDMLFDGTPTRQDLIDDRDALAAQNVLMREALKRLSTITEHDNVDSYMLDVQEAERVLALPLPDAAREVAEWRRDSERLTLDSASAQASDAIIARIKEERRLQDRKWGGSTYDDQHSLGDWAHLIEQRTSTLYRAPEHKVAKQELIEVAALAVAALESLWRNREGK